MAIGVAGDNNCFPMNQPRLEPSKGDSEQLCLFFYYLYRNCMMNGSLLEYSSVFKCFKILTNYSTLI